MTTSTTNAPFIPREDIEKRANEVLRQHGLETIPVDPVVLANQLGIKVFNAKFSDDSLVGMIAKRGADITLLVNQSDPPARKRFTIAHELGHHFLHLQEDGEFVDGEANLFRQEVPEDEDKLSPDRRREIQANMFAAALLMPEEEVRQAWKLHQSIEVLARKFNVSETAMYYRINQLGLE